MARILDNEQESFTSASVDEDDDVTMLRMPEEVTLKRMIRKCNIISKISEESWRYNAYVIRVEELLTFIRKDSQRPSQDVINEYAKEVKLLQNHKEYLQELSFSEIKSDSPEDNNSEKPNELHQRKKGKKGPKEEVILDEPKTNVSLRILADEKTKKKIVNEEKDDQQKQDQLIEDMLSYVNDIKESAKAVQKLTKYDIKKLQDATTIADMNHTNLSKETSQLSKYLDKAFSYWMWIMVVIVILTFIYMVIFIRLFKKPIVDKY